MTPFFMAWGMFWIVPCPVRHWDSGKYREMLLCMPLIGLLIGLVWTGEAALLNALLPDGITGAALLAVTPWFLTGFLHLDGFMDCSDAVLSRRPREQRLQILKDSHVGSFAVICLAVLSLLQYGACNALDLTGRVWILLFIPAVSRSASAFCVLNLTPMETSSYAAMHRDGIRPLYRVLPLLQLLLWIAAAFLLTGRAAFCLLGELAGFACAAAYVLHDLGAMNGDISGCAITVSECAALAALLLIP